MLDWIGKSKVGNHHLDVPYHVLDWKWDFGGDAASGNMVIRGDNLLALMASPVLRKIRLAVVPEGLPTAGIEALAERTMLAPDNDPTYAVKRGDERIDEAKDTKYSGPTVEIWRYDPLIFSEDGRRVDSLSLWLSLRDETDPRVRKEMDSMMEALKW